MGEYRRPTVTVAEFRDESGAVIRYGRRWNGGEPPAESYSVTHDLERFRPLHAVAEALIAHLVGEYDVGVEDDPAAATKLVHPRDDVVRAVRLVPADRTAAPMTFVFTSFPSVILHAGALHDFPYPVCGCDACDEDWEHLARELEWHVRAVVDGGFRERVEPSHALGIAFSLSAPDGSTHSGTARADDLPADLVAAARAALPHEGAWAAWTRRAARPDRPLE